MTAIQSIATSGITTSDRQPTAEEVARIDQSFEELLGNDDTDPGDAAKQEFAAMTQNGAAGYWAWQVKQMREKAAGEVMSAMHVTKEQIAGMDAKERVAIEKKIEDLVEQKVRQEIAESSKKKQQQAVVASASMNSIITNAQGIKEQIARKNGNDVTVATNKPSDPTDLLVFGFGS